MNTLLSTNTKSTNPVRTVRTTLYLNGKAVTTVSVQKRAKDDKSLTQEVVYWARQFGLEAGQPEGAKAARTATRKPKGPKVDPVVAAQQPDAGAANGQSELIS